VSKAFCYNTGSFACSRSERVLAGFDCKFIFLSASELEITRREAQRADRLHGSAIHWLKTFDFQDACDLIYDTEDVGIQQIATSIIRRFDILIEIQGFVCLI
jgi:chloramphenicol 3-O-phosphotransferase